MNNNTTTTVSAPTDFIRALMRFSGVLGVLGVLINVFILVVFVSSKQLLRSSAFVVALTFTHAFNSAVNAIRGFWPDQPAGVLVSPLDCVNLIFPALYFTTFQILPIILALAGVERLLALGAPIWYRATCTNRRQWFLVSLVLMYSGVSLACNWLLAWSRAALRITGCTQSQIFGFAYMMYGCHGPAVLGGLVATVCTAAGVTIGRRRVIGMMTSSVAFSQSALYRARKQIRLSKCLLTISLIDIVLVVIPNIVLILYNTNLVNFPLMYTLYPATIYGSDALFNIVAFVWFSRDFRKAARRLLRLKGGQIQPSVVNLSGSKVMPSKGGG